MHFDDAGCVPAIPLIPLFRLKYLYENQIFDLNDHIALENILAMKDE